jgi:hypothetical protein
MKHSRTIRGVPVAFVFAFLALQVLAQSTRHPALLAIYFVVTSGVVLANLRRFRSFTARERIGVAVLAASLTLMLPLSMLEDPTGLAHYVVTLVSLGAAYVLTRNAETFLRAIRLCLLGAQAGLLVFVLIVGLDDFPLEKLLQDTSSNGITAYLILLQATYSTFLFQLHRRASLITPIVTLAICVIGYGRGSILIASAIVVVNLLASIPWKNKTRTAWVLLLAGFMAAGVYVAYGEQIAEFVELSTKIGTGLVSEPRERMIAEYLGRIDARTLVTGANFHGTTIETEFHDNPHNSYIRAHHLFGLPYLLALVLFVGLAATGRLRGSVSIYSLCMLALVLLRATTEAILFGTPLDFFFFALCFMLSRQLPSARAVPRRRHARRRLPPVYRLRSSSRTHPMPEHGAQTAPSAGSL